MSDEPVQAKLELHFPVSLMVLSMPNGEEALRVESNGKFYVKGKEVGDDKEVVEAFRWFLECQGFLPPRAPDAE
jgi:hypothetical protein